MTVMAWGAPTGPTVETQLAQTRAELDRLREGIAVLIADVDAWLDDPHVVADRLAALLAEQAPTQLIDRLPR